MQTKTHLYSKQCLQCIVPFMANEILDFKLSSVKIKWCNHVSPNFERSQSENNPAELICFEEFYKQLMNNNDVISIVGAFMWEYRNFLSFSAAFYIFNFIKNNNNNNCVMWKLPNNCFN